MCTVAIQKYHMDLLFLLLGLFYNFNSSTFNSYRENIKTRKINLQPQKCFFFCVKTKSITFFSKIKY